MALDDDTLQRYYDGALDAGEAERVQREVATSASAQQRLRELERLSALMRSAVAGHQLDADALFAGIEGDIRKQEALGFGARLRVISSEWYEHKRAVLVPALASAAVAAAALITLLVPHDTNGPDGSLPEGESALAALATTNVHGSSIENVDFGLSTGTVFEVESEGVRAAVVWIADDEEEGP